MTRIAVSERWGESFDVDVRGHRLVVDEPVTYGGEDAGPTPTELMVSALAASVAQAVHDHLAAAGLPVEPVVVGADFTWAAEGPRVAGIRLQLELPGGLARDQRESALRAAELCPVWQALREPPELELMIETAAPAAI